MSVRRLARLLGVQLARRASGLCASGACCEAEGSKYAWRNFHTDTRGYEHFRRRRQMEMPWERPPGAGGSGPRVPRLQTIVTVVVVGGGVVLYFSSRQEVPYTHRMHTVFISSESEKRLGEALFQQTKEDAQREGTLLPSTHPAARLVRSVGDRIIQKVTDERGGGYQEHLKGLKWEYAVIRNKTMNAFVLPGGKIVVFTGLLDLLDERDELAAVLGHEAGHVVARHHVRLPRQATALLARTRAERISKLALITLLQILVFLFLGVDLPPILTDIAFTLPNTRSQEKEADIIGMDLAARACFAPDAAMSTFTKLGAVEKKMGVSIPRFLRTHPLSEERVQALMRHLPKARNWAEIEGCSVSLTGFESDLMPMLMDPLPRQAVRPAPGRPAAAQQQTPDTDDPFDF